MNEDDGAEMERTLDCVLEGLLSQVRVGMSFEHARGAFRITASLLGVELTAPSVKDGTQRLHLAWRDWAIARPSSHQDGVYDPKLPATAPGTVSENTESHFHTERVVQTGSALHK